MRAAAARSNEILNPMDVAPLSAVVALPDGATEESTEGAIVAVTLSEGTSGFAGATGAAGAAGLSAGASEDDSLCAPPSGTTSSSNAFDSSSPSRFTRIGFSKPFAESPFAILDPTATPVLNLKLNFSVLSLYSFHYLASLNVQVLQVYHQR